ncbi:transposase [Alicyclobacillus fodiniaquatilis]|uniref:Transposase n=1 Tax=Alicyclobacillus fodiniaquatilis TaxID=1661150 RepID=A0ABW4JNV2_9BACL
MFIEYNMDQLYLPMNLELDIPPNHISCVVNTAVTRLDDAIFEIAYPGGGRDSYHPKMMTKIVIYAYTQRIYSSRQIAKAVRENVPFMWLAGRQTPDFRTINRFRIERMKDVLEKIFTDVLELLVEEGYVKLENYFVDGTKTEANANRYTFVWGKAVAKHKARLQEKVKTLFASIEELERQEELEHSGHDLLEQGESSQLTSKDTWTCMNGRKLTFERQNRGKTDSGYQTQLRTYRSENCEGCLLRERCMKSSGNREIRVSLEYLRYKQQAAIDEMRQKIG